MYDVPVQRSDRDCKRVGQAGIPSPDASHPGVFKAVWVNPSNSPSLAARGVMSLSSYRCSRVVKRPVGRQCDVTKEHIEHTTRHSVLIVDLSRRAATATAIAAPPRHHLVDERSQIDVNTAK